MALLTVAPGETAVPRIVSILRQAIQYLNSSIPVSGGGTGDATLTAHSVLLGEGTSAVGFATIGTAGRVLIDQGAAADPAFEVISGDVALTSAGVASVGSTSTWTPIDSSGASLTFTSPIGAYTKIGNMVFAYGSLTYPSTASASAAKIGGLPFTSANNSNAFSVQPTFINTQVSAKFFVNQNATTFQPYAGTGGALTNTQMTAAVCYFNLSYPVS